MCKLNHNELTMKLFSYIHICIYIYTYIYMIARVCPEIYMNIFKYREYQMTHAVRMHILFDMTRKPWTFCQYITWSFTHKYLYHTRLSKVEPPPVLITIMASLTWRRFPCYWPFVRGIHRSPVNFTHIGPTMPILDILFNLNKLLNKQSG